MKDRFSSADLLKETRELNRKHEAAEALSATFDAVAKIAEKVQDADQRAALQQHVEQGRMQLRDVRRTSSKFNS